MSKILIVIQVLVFNLGVCYSQSIGSQLIGSAGEFIQSKSGISLTYSVGEPVVDSYKCVYNYRIGFIQSIPIYPAAHSGIGFNHSSPIAATTVTNPSNTYQNQEEKYILFDAVGRILQKGINFRRGDPTIHFPMTGIYFVQTFIDRKTVNTEKIFVSR